MNTFSNARWPSVCLLEKCLSRSSACFFDLLFDVELYELFIYFGYQPFVGHIICKHFLPFSKLSFHLGPISLSSPLCLLPEKTVNKILLQFMSKHVLPVFSSKSFIVSGLCFRSFIHFEFIFFYGVKKYSNLILLHVAVQFS